MDLGLQGRAALVTAGSKGLGRAIARRLAQEGVLVCVSARGEDDLRETVRTIENEGGKAMGVVADVSTPDGCARAVRETEKEFGALDILVTNTGGPKAGMFDDCSDEDWIASFDSTLLNIVRLVRAAAPGMKERGWGRIVNVASVSAKQPIKGLTISNALRPAIVGLSKSLADELAPHGVTINTLCPGMHATDRLLHLRQNAGESAEALHDRLAESIPVGRVGEPGAFGDAAAYLCSAGAAFVTGTTLVVDGGAARGLA